MDRSASIDRASALVAKYDRRAPEECASGLRELWLQCEPKSIDAISEEQRGRQETLGIPIPVLRPLGKEVGKAARRRVTDFIPLVRLLWDSYGREGRVVSLVALGAMELADPSLVVPLLRNMCRSCITWEDADRMAMDALEPIVRKNPGEWLPRVEPWLTDESKWVRRAGITVAGRLPMRHPSFTTRCLELAQPLTHDAERDVRKAVSFAIRLCTRGDRAAVREFLERNIPPGDSAATWVLCDAARSMARKELPHFVTLIPLYEQWAGNPDLSSRDRRSVESALRVLRNAQS